MNRCEFGVLAPVPGRTAIAPDWSIGSGGWQGGASGGLRPQSWSSLLLLLAVAAALLAGCSTPPDEARLRRTIAEMQQAAEARKPGDVVEAVSDDFAGSNGLDRDRLRRLLQAAMLRNQQIGVTLGPLDVAVDGDRATVRFVAMTTGGRGGLIPERARGYRVVSEWRIEDGEWRVVRADWTGEP